MSIGQIVYSLAAEWRWSTGRRHGRTNGAALAFGLLLSGLAWCASSWGQEPPSWDPGRIGRVNRLARQPETPESAPPARMPERIQPRGRVEERDAGAGTGIPPIGVEPPSRLQLLQPLPPELNDPLARPKVEREYGRFVERTIDPEMTLDVVTGRPRILVFRDLPKRLYMADDAIATYDVISDTEISVVGRAPGRTVLTVWVADPDMPAKTRVLSYLVRVADDPTAKVRLETVYAALEREINQNFPDSFVKLALIGDQLVVRGQAKDVIEAGQILRIVRQHAPPSRRQNRPERQTNIAINQTAYSPQGVMQANEQLGATLDQLADAAELEGESQIINLLQVPGEQQVMLRVTVAEVNRSALRSIGASMSISGGSGVGFDSKFPAVNLVEEAATGLLALEGGTLSVTRGDLRLAVNALKHHNLARSLAEPNLVTLHGRPARFQAGGQFPVPAAAVGFGTAAQGVEFVPFGVQLQFVPYIVDRDKVRLTMAANVSTRDEAQAASVNGTSVPGLTTRNFQNTVELREGQTLAVAGLIQQNFGARSSRVPWLGDLPIAGRLFKSDGTSTDEQELVILITPQLVHPLESSDCLPLPGSDVFEPNDIEFYLKGYLESRRAEDFRSPVRTDLARMRRYHRCDDEFILGPHGHAYRCQDSSSITTGHSRSTWSTPASPGQFGVAPPPVESLPAPIVTPP